MMEVCGYLERFLSDVNVLKHMHVSYCCIVCTFALVCYVDFGCGSVFKSTTKAVLVPTTLILLIGVLYCIV
jgi:hypothetical protein